MHHLLLSDSFTGKETVLRQYDFDTIYPRKNTACFKYDALQFRFQTENVIPLSVADMDFAAPPEVLEAMQTRLQHPIFGYNFRSKSYYQSFIDWIQSKHNWAIKRDWLCDVPGVVTGINMAILSLTNRGDKVLIQDPVYHPFFDAIRAHERVLVTSTLLNINGRYEIDFDDFASKAKGCKLFILCSPHNPVGRVWSEDELLTLGRICRKERVIVVADEIHSDLIYEGVRHTPFASLEDFSAFTIACYSPSKTFNIAGLSTSMIVIPNEDLYEKYATSTYDLALYMGNTLGMVAFEASYSQGHNWLKALMLYLNENLQIVRESFSSETFIDMIEPEGTYLAWLDCRKLAMDEETLLQFFLQKAHVALEPGPVFGNSGSGYMRLNYGCPRSTLKQALQQIHTALRKL